MKPDSDDEFTLGPALKRKRILGGAKRKRKLKKNNISDSDDEMFDQNDHEMFDQPPRKRRRPSLKTKAKTEKVPPPALFSNN